ncbi:MAG: ABC transporter substrate-binding protein [Chitinophagaceae bacterium]|nr:ABC transporter substrate-binding protein [Chitinophagaceae bacterium]
MSNRVDQRIVSLVPSQTELLYDLGLNDEVVGITKFCIHPNHWFRNKTRIGGTKDVKFDRVKGVSPTLIIANKEENVKEQVEALAAIAPVYTSDISTLEDAYHMIHEIGKITHTSSKAEDIIEEIKAGFRMLAKELDQQMPKTCLYLIWKEPYMSVGKDTFIHDMMLRCKLENVMVNESRYPSINIAQIQQLAPEIILLSSEPYPFKEKHIAELQAYLPQTSILLVDGEMFSWYGSRLQHSPAYFCGLRDTINSSSTRLKS